MHCDFVVFDLETTGLSSRFDEIIQIAATRLGQGGVVTAEVFATFVRPEASIPSFITGVTGISNRDVADAPPVAAALAAFSDFVGDAVLIAHNGQRFDAKFLTAACEQQQLNSRPVALIDSIHFSKRLFGTTRGTDHRKRRVSRKKNIFFEVLRRSIPTDTTLFKPLIFGGFRPATVNLSSARSREANGPGP